MKSFLRRGLAPLLLALVAAVPVNAQTQISGYLSGTLAAGVYVAVGNLNVDVGQTLVLAPGVIIKSNGARYITISGTLLSNGTAGNPVIFTDYADDSAGGDTNGNGPSTGSPGSWYGIAFASTSSGSVLNRTEVRYAGAGSYPGIGFYGAAPTLSNCTVRNGYNQGVALDGAARPTLANCNFSNNGGTAIENVAIQALPGFTNNTASGNGRNVVAVTSASIPFGTSLQIAPANMLAGAIVLETNLSVAPTATLTLAAGVVIKSNGARYVPIDGTLICNGTQPNPVVFTSYSDDSVGGDTNNNGPSTGSPGQWYGLAIVGASANATALAWTEVRFAGAGSYPGVGIGPSTPAFAHCTLRDGYNQGFQLGSGSRPLVQDCVISGNGGTAIEGVAIDAVPGFVNNAASGNGRNILSVNSGTVGPLVQVQPHSMLTGAIVIETNLDVPAGNTLVLAAGVVIKCDGARYIPVNGTLLCNGTQQAPVIFTSYSDDTAGGNTNGGGASTGSPGQWYGILLNGTGASGSALTWTEVRFAGAGSYPGVSVAGSAPALSHCTVRNGYNQGLVLDGGARPAVTDCAFNGNGGIAVDVAALESVTGFLRNAASGNGQSYLRVNGASINAPLTIGPQSHLNGAIVLATNLSVQAAGSLEILQGCVFKMEGARYHTFAGPVQLRGTAYEPVVFTALSDDEYGGDTNGNGPSSGSPGSWYGLNFMGSAGGAAENVIVRHAGAGSYPGFACTNPGLVLRAVRADLCYNQGFVLSAAMSAVNLVAWACGGIGIHLSSGTFDLLHATSAGNGVGMRAEAAWSGAVVNSIARQNSTNLQNFAAASFRRSNGGFSGQNGCIDQDPRFVNLAQGDLRLLATSPCLDVADYNTAIAVQKDWSEYPRAVYHSTAGAALADMGAHERAPWHMEVFGPAALGNTVFLTVQGPAGDSFLGFGLLDGAVMIQPYGQVLAGLPGGTLALVFPFPIAVGTPIPLTVPSSAGLVGTILGMQSLNLLQGNWAVGAFSELYRVRVRP
jgi:parallel beta-helix repeat protein